MNPPQNSNETAGDLIDRYKLIAQIGEGGMGTIWMAEQLEPVKRRVALKVIKLGMDTKQVIARFEAERQALAMMDHSNIARVFDAGATASGRPYFVMEYIEGVPILDYCDKEKVDTKSRLKLFMSVCQAIQHAHQKGVIHRDIKPSNVLVTLQDGVAVPKVIDFGIAKATNVELATKTLFTEQFQVVGTPAYMSPEQADLSGLDIDTRSDIYSLGVLLYELLTGTTPFDIKGLLSKGFAEMMRTIREVEPHKPSTRVSTLGETATRIALLRSVDADKLRSQLRGDLDWIVMKCLEKNRTRRYETATGLADDIKRHLDDQPVTAGAPSTGYRLYKFVMRNRVQVLAAGAVMLALLLGVVAFAWKAREAERQRDAAVVAKDAEVTQRKLADLARADAVAQRAYAEEQEAEARKQAAEAKKQASIAEAVSNFLADMLSAVDPNNLLVDPVTKKPLRDKVTVLQAIAATIKELDGGALSDQPLVEAGVRDAIGTTLLWLANYQEAGRNLQKSLELRRAHLPAGHAEIARSTRNLGLFHREQNKLVEAEASYREALEMYRAARPDKHPDLAIVMNDLATILQDQNKLGEAGEFFREALGIVRAAFPPKHKHIAVALSNYALLLRDTGKLAEAEPLFREALEIFRAVHAAGHPDIAACLDNLGAVLQQLNKTEEAEPLCRESLEIARGAFPEGHPNIGAALNNLGQVLRAQGKFAQAEPLFGESLKIARASLPPRHPNLALTLNNLASVMQSLNKHAESEPLHREALEIRRASLPEGHPYIAQSLGNLGALYWRLEKFDEAVPLLEEAIAIQESAFGRGNRRTQLSIATLGRVHKDAGRFVDAIPLLEEAYEASKREQIVAWAGEQLLGAHTKAADPSKPETVNKVVHLVQEMLADARAGMPKDSIDLGARLASYSMTLLTVKAWDKAEPLIREALVIREAKQPDDYRTFNTKSLLGAALMGQGRLGDAEPLLLAGYQGMVERRQAIPPQGVVRIEEALERLVRLYEEKKNGEEAAKWRGLLEKARAAASKPAGGGGK